MLVNALCFFKQIGLLLKFSWDTVGKKAGFLDLPSDVLVFFEFPIDIGPGFGVFLTASTKLEVLRHFKFQA